jgi:PhnB protein
MTKNNNNRTIQPYLFFNGKCEEAIECYRKALGAEVEMMMRFKESPEPQPPGTVPPDFDNKIMHASFRVGETRLLNVATDTEADRVFAALSDGGEVKMPLTKTFWSPRFGMLQDRFGIGWMINVVTSEQK